MTSYKNQKLLKSILNYVILTLVAIIVLIPLLITISSSFKGESALFEFPFKFLPESPTGANFAQLLDKFPMYTFNSARLTLTIVIVQLITASTGAYVFSKLKWKGRDVIFTLYLASMMIPSQAVMIPQFIIIRKINLYDTHAALVLLGAFTAFGTFLIRQFMLSIPDTYCEAARIDGAKEWTIFLKLIMPMSKSVLVTQIIFSFRFFWNDFFTPLIYITSDDLKTLPLGMTDFVREQYVYWGPQLAAALISIIPVLIVFLFGQKYFIQGVSSSGLKG
jgi:multiple sugar transport system permease protein